MIDNIVQFTDFSDTFYSDSEIVTEDTYESINNSLRNIIFTSKGEKVGDPEFGSDLKRMVFSQIDFITIHLIKSSLLDAIEFYEPRVSVQSLDIIASPDENTITIKVIYVIIASPDIEGKYVGVIKRI